MAVATVRSVPAPPTRNRTRDEHREPDVEFLDLDGDGVPDAVRITRSSVLRWAPDGREEVVKVISELDAGIGVDGIAATVETTETLEIHLGTDDGGAVADVVEGASPRQ